MPLILGTNSIKDTGYNVANSLRFNDGSSDYLNRTLSGSGNTKKFTISFWQKLGTGFSADRAVISGGADANNYLIVRNSSSQTIQILETVSGSDHTNLVTNRLFRDVSAWYHIVVAIDTTQGTDTNRVKLYVNGTQETSFSTATYPGQNDDLQFNNNTAHAIGRRQPQGNIYMDGYLAEFVFVDNQQLDPTSFGEFDEDSGIWKPIDVSGLTFGTNGFYLEFKGSGTSANSSGLGADTSGNDLHFTVNNLTAIDQSTDTCTNNFATLNLLDNFYGSGTFAEGNLKVTTPSSGSAFNTGTIGVSSGKWFWEVKYVSDTDGSANYSRIGITGRVATASNDSLGNSNSMQYASINGAKGYNGGSNSYGDTYAPGDIIGVALDLDSGTQTITFYKNGSSQGAIDLALINGGTPTGFWFPAVHYDDGSNSGVFEINFGSPSFAISSGNTDGEGFGNFEFAVPSGYFALCTKNLAEYG